MTDDRPPVLPPDKARAGRTSGRVTTVLVISFILAALALGAAWLYWSQMSGPQG
jgi:hypothetical protein